MIGVPGGPKGPVAPSHPGCPSLPSRPGCPSLPSLPGRPGRQDAVVAGQVLAASVVRYTAVIMKQVRATRNLAVETRHLSLATLLLLNVEALLQEVF